MERYLSGDIDENLFCDNFYHSYDLEINDEALTDNELIAFAELGEVVGRFSLFKEDSKTHYNKEDLKKKIVETNNKLYDDKSLLLKADKENLKKVMPEITDIATTIESDWLMCPICVDAWQTDSQDLMVRCPKCEQILHNPRFKTK